MFCKISWRHFAKSPTVLLYVTLMCHTLPVTILRHDNIPTKTYRILQNKSSSIYVYKINRVRFTFQRNVSFDLLCRFRPPYGRSIRRLRQYLERAERWRFLSVRCGHPCTNHLSSVGWWWWRSGGWGEWSSSNHWMSSCYQTMRSRFRHLFFRNQWCTVAWQRCLRWDRYETQLWGYQQAHLAWPHHSGRIRP